MDREKVLRLLDPLRTSNYRARNRFLRSATYLAAAGGDSGAMSAAELRRLTEVAAGGAGSVISGFAYVSLEGKTAPKQWGLHCDARTEDVRKLAAAVHKHDSRLIVQIVHSGGQRAAQYGGVSYSPSGLPHPASEQPTKALSIDEIAMIVRQFAAAALRAKEGGADAVEVHAGHGFLLTQFLSPIINKREDEYGGTLENRARIFFDILRETKRATGGDYPVWFKVSIAEGLENGYSAADGLHICEKLLAAGADGIEISSGATYAGAQNRPSIIGVSAGESEAPFKEYALALKKYATAEQVITLTGGLRSLEVMGDLLAEGYCDLFGLSRPLIAEADLINRWYEEDARPSVCISCNACSRTAANGPINCPVWREKHEGNWDPL